MVFGIHFSVQEMGSTDWKESDITDLVRVIDVVDGARDPLARITRELSSFVDGPLVLVRHDVTERGWGLEFFHLAGLSAQQSRRVSTSFTDMVARAPVQRNFTTFNPLWVEVERRNRLVVVDRAPESEAGLRIMREMGWFVARARQSVMLCDGPLLLGSLAAFRDEPYTLKEQMVFRRVLQPLRRRIRLERRLANRACPTGVDTMLEAIEAPAFILRGASIEHMNSAGAEWFESRGTELFALVAAASAGVACVGGTIVERFELGVPGECWGTLVMIRCAPAARDARVERAIRAWRLSSRQSEILTLIAEGLSNKDAAARMRVSLKTVEWHTGLLLKKARCETRPQLLARYWRL